MRKHKNNTHANTKKARPDPSSKDISEPSSKQSSNTSGTKGKQRAPHLRKNSLPVISTRQVSQDAPSSFGSQQSIKREPFYYQEKQEVPNTLSSFGSEGAQPSIKREPFYYQGKQELPFVKASTDPTPQSIQQVRNSIVQYHETEMERYRNSSSSYQPVDYSSLPSWPPSSGGIPMSVIHSTDDVSNQFSPNTLPSWNEVKAEKTPIARKGSNGSCSLTIPSPAESMFSSISAKTDRTNWTYPGTLRPVGTRSPLPTIRAIAPSDGGHSHTVTYPLSNPSLGQYPLLPSLQHSSSEMDFPVHTGLESEYTDMNGDCQSIDTVYNSPHSINPTSPGVSSQDQQQSIGNVPSPAYIGTTAAPPFHRSTVAPTTARLPSYNEYMTSSNMVMGQSAHNMSALLYENNTYLSEMNGQTHFGGY